MSIKYVWKRPCERYYHVWFKEHFSARTAPPADDDPDMLYKGESYPDAFRIAETANAKLLPHPAAAPAARPATLRQPEPAPIGAAARPKVQMSLFG